MIDHERTMRRQPAIWIITTLAAIATVSCGHQRRAQPVTLAVSVAASLQNALREIAPVYEQLQPGVKLSLNFGASGTLAQQIERGAPADVFFPAASTPMDWLASKGLILSETRRNLLTNQLVLIVPGDSQGIKSFRDLSQSAVKLIALGDPDSVPAGDYGRQVLRAFKIWETIQSKLVLAKDVRQVLTYVETGNADAGIVYATDARESNKVRIVETAPEGSHTAVLYPIAVVRDSENVEAARALVSFLSGSQASAVFTKHGFTTVPR